MRSRVVTPPIAAIVVVNCRSDNLTQALGAHVASVDELNPSLQTPAGMLRNERRARALLANPVAVFVLLSFIFGILALVLTPPLRGPDEPAHFLRIYAIARGEIVPTTADANGRKGTFLPHRLHRDFEFFEGHRHGVKTPGFSYRNVLREHLQRRAQPAADGPPVFAYYSGSEGYNPVAYLPYLAAAFVARLLDLDFLPTFYLMRITGLATMTAVVAYAIAIVPRLGWAFLFIAMLPAALYARAMISPDSGGLAYTMVTTALCLRAASGLDPGKLWQQSLWMTLCALSKPPQLALVLLAAMTRPFKALPRYWRPLSLIILPSFVLSALWVVFGSVDIGAWRYFEGAGLPREHFDPAWKLAFMLKHPLHFPTVLIGSFRDIDWMWWGLIGMLGWLDTELRAWVYPVLSIALIAVCLTPLQLDRQARYWIAAVASLSALAYVIAVYLIFFLVWTSIYAGFVEGVQGRYFVMALPPCALALAALVNRGPVSVVTAFIATAGAVLSGVAVAEAILRVDWPAV